MGGGENTAARGFVLVMDELQSSFVADESSSPSSGESDSPPRTPDVQAAEEIFGSPFSQETSPRGSDAGLTPQEEAQQQELEDEVSSCGTSEGEMLAPGMHIYVVRGLAQHHGIVTLAFPEVFIAHFDALGDAVREVTLEEFLCLGGEGKEKASASVVIRHARYGDSRLNAMLLPGAHYTEEAGTTEEVLRRVKASLAEGSSWSGYSAMLNNGEQFATWAMTGKRPFLSRQSQRGLYLVGALTAVAAAAAAAVGAAGAAGAAAGAATVPLRLVRLRAAVQCSLAIGVATVGAVELMGKSSASVSGPGL